MAAVECVVLGSANVHAEQFGQRCRRKPMTVQPPLRTGCEQSLDDQDAQDLFPVRVLTGHGQPCREKIVQVERAPQVISQPARPH
jgi:hypothetical protein